MSPIQDTRWGKQWSSLFAAKIIQVKIDWLLFVSNSLLVVPKRWILIGDCYAANPSAQHTTTAVGGLCGDWGV